MLVLHVVYFKPPINSSTVHDLHFPALSRNLSFNFQDLPGLKKSRKNPGLSRMRENRE